MPDYWHYTTICVETISKDSPQGRTNPDLDGRFIFQGKNVTKVDKSRTRKGKGTGLGLDLAITKKIIEAHGGSIDVFSKPGEGCRFVFSVPKGLQKVL